MNEHAAALLHNLAAKLGTTSEYLWAVLVKQAPISSFITLGEYALVAVLFATLYRFRLQIGGFMRDWFAEEEVSAFFASAIAGLTLAVLLIACLLSFSSMLTGFLNPEYWALKEVLSAVKSK
jgi:hypothetical protein